MNNMKNPHQFGFVEYVMICSLALLVVQGAPTAKDRNEPNNGPLQIVSSSSTPNFVTEGKRMDLECYFSGWPFPQEVYWYKDGKIITNGTEGIYHSEDKRTKNGHKTLRSKLSLPSGREELEGIYKCMAKNSIQGWQSEVSEYLQLIYLCPRPESPTIFSSGKVPGNKSSKVRLTCLIDYGGACPQRFFWDVSNNQAPLQENDEKYETEIKDTHSKCKKELILSIFNVTKHDEGIYSCHWHCKYRDPMKATFDLKVSDEPHTGA